MRKTTNTTTELEAIKVRNSVRQYLDKPIAEKIQAIQTCIDLGIAKYHFEVGAGKENFVWKMR